MQSSMMELVEKLGLPAFAQQRQSEVVFQCMSRDASQRYRADLREPQSFHLEGGTAALLGALAAQLPRAQILLGARVIAMFLDENSTDVTIRRDDAKFHMIATKQIDEDGKLKSRIAAAGTLLALGGAWLAQIAAWHRVVAVAQRRAVLVGPHHARSAPRRWRRRGAHLEGVARAAAALCAPGTERDAG